MRETMTNVMRTMAFEPVCRSQVSAFGKWTYREFGKLFEGF